MKHPLLFTLIILCATAQSQTIMRIHQSNGTVIQIPISTIDSITYTNSNPGNPATLNTLAIGNITDTSATSGGSITNDGGSPITQRGICWATTQNPTTANNTALAGTGTGSFTANLTGLAANTTYYVRAYVINTAGTAYGNQLSFTTTDFMAEFLPINGKLRVDYYVTASNVPYKVPIGVTNVSNQNRTISLQYASRSAVPGVQFNGPEFITIPAGKSVDTIFFNGVFTSYPAGRIDTVKIKFKDIPARNGRDSFELIMERYCDVLLTTLNGEYNNTNEYSSSGAFTYGPYATAVENLVATGPSKAEGYFVNLYDEGWNNIKFIMEWTNPANFTITIPEQATGKLTGIIRVRSSSGKTNTFSSCDQTFSISLDMLNASGGVLTSGYQIRLIR